jgi:hypothetical protein
MKHKKRIAILALGALLIAAVVWAVSLPRDPMFHGKRESEWITNIVYKSEDQYKELVQQWRDFGPEGLRVLERGLAANRAQKYQKIYYRLAKYLPNSVMRLFPTPPPKTEGGTRYLVVHLLCNMGKDAYPAWPAVARTLSDEDLAARSSAVSFFTHPEADKAFLNQLPTKDKKKLLPLFISAMEYDGWYWNLRNNAALALKSYPEEASLFVPSLLKALKDPSPHVRLSAADALNRVNPAAATKAGALGVVSNLLQNPDSGISVNATLVIRQFQHEADAAVTALIDALHGTNRAVVGVWAVWSLQAFPKQTARILPELRKAAEQNDDTGKHAAAALR